MKQLLLLMTLLMSAGNQLCATVRLPQFFTHNMVLQRNAPIPVWGWAAANEKIVVQLHGQTKTVKANKNGEWKLLLDAESAGGPYQLQVKGQNTHTFNNVLIGEVWLCSGQSNMEWTVAQSSTAKQTMAKASNPFIRHIKVLRQISALPQNDAATSGWQLCDSSTVGSFTAVGYYFAQRIYDSLKVPVGLIHSSWGGTNVETWISREGFESSEVFKAMIARMPKVNLDSLAELKVRGKKQSIAALQGTPISGSDNALYKESSYEDAQWPELYAPQSWEEQSIGELDGVVWLRKTIVLPPNVANKAAILHLAKIDDDDIAYINGIKVGATNQWDAKRAYTVPAGVLKAGNNVIAVRVDDHGGGGGIWGEPEDLKLVIENTVVPLVGKWKFRVASILQQVNENALPSLCYNAMINPLVPYAMRGVLWYQGESNVGRAFEYRHSFPLLITDWRKKWGQGDFPFYYVQLATFNNAGNSNEGCGWAELREAQTLTLQLPQTGMSVTTDIGNPTDIHPTNKLSVGNRLAAIALNNTYGRSMVYTGPAFKSMQTKDNELILSFDHIGGGLLTPDKYGYLKGFEIAGADGRFYFAQAFIRNNQVVVSSPQVPHPVAVRFGWMADASECNLFNKEGFPAVPFRTDDWKTVTKAARYVIEAVTE